MRVLLVSTSYPSGEEDWRGRFIADMTQAIICNSIKLSVWSPAGHLPKNAINAVPERDQDWLRCLQTEGGIIHLLRNKPVKGLWAATSLLRRLNRCLRSQEFDVAHINWLQNALSLGCVHKPALVTVLGSDYGLLKVPGMVSLLRRVIKGRKCIVAPNAEWMVPKLQKCFGDIAEIRPIPFGIHQRFLETPRAKSAIPRWLVVSRITHKKIGKLFEWGEANFGPQRELHLFGPMQEKVDLPNWVFWHGPTNPNQLAQSWFPYATGLITLSHHNEGRPQVMLDAMAAGLPVIASSISAHQDLIQHAKTGWIVNSAEKFGEALHTLEDPFMNNQVGNAARQYVLQTIGTWADCANRYEQAYRDLLAQ